MNKLLPAAAVAIGLACGIPNGVRAQALCTTAEGPCASDANQVLQYLRQAIQLVQETTTATQEVTNTLALGTTAFSDLTGTIQQITTIANQANMLVGLSGQMLTNIRTPGGYPIGYGTATLGWHQQMTNEANAVGTAMNSAGQVLNALQTLSTDAAKMATLVNQIMAAVGRQQSLQTLQSALSQMTQTLQRTQATQTTNQQAALTRAMAQQDRQYLTQTVNDHDLEGTWVSECNAITALGGAAQASCQ
jgi:hypothetical protein